MSQHCGYIIKVDKLRPHTNADKLQILEIKIEKSLVYGNK